MFNQLAKEAVERCEILSKFSEDPNVYVRTFLSSPMKNVKESMNKWYKEIGLEFREDALGNLIGRKKSTINDAPVFLIGSHLDTVPNAGKYDGILGVILAISALTILEKEDFDFHVDILGFSEEEGVRYKSPYLGSSAIAGKFDLSLLEKKDRDGISLRDAIINYGLDPSQIPKAAYDPKKILGYIELHIEQGPILDQKKLQLGLVTGISGQTRISGTILGEAGHAGTIPTSMRKDCMLGFAEIITKAEEYLKKETTVFMTFGKLGVFPGASNVIPGKIEFTIDIRNEVDQKRHDAESFVKSLIEEVCKKRELTFQVNQIEKQDTIKCNPYLMSILKNSMVQNQFDPFLIPSGAGHDAAVLAKITPITMLFLRSPDGISHNPKESVHLEDVEASLKVLVSFFREVNELVKKGEYKKM